MAANYAKSVRVGSLDIGFQQVPTVQNFSLFHSIVTECSLYKNK